ncbi:MAG: hypothetical protein JW774_01715 [Candidatus Aureabacteria bacterium]|nr:hypothetical protein [Candidatus Auribacterota bacterium]
MIAWFLSTGFLCQPVQCFSQSVDSSFLAPSHSAQDLTPIMVLAGKMQGNQPVIWDVSATGVNKKVIIVVKSRERVHVHWGKSRYGNWEIPPEAIWPDHTTKMDDKAVQTALQPVSDNIRVFSVTIPNSMEFNELEFVLFYPDRPPHNQWVKDGNRNYKITVKDDPGLEEMAGETKSWIHTMIEGERGEHGRSLMHRNKFVCELLGRFPHCKEFFSTLAVYMRYNRLGVLPWQRGYNTTPREMTASVDRLNETISRLMITDSKHYSMVRLLMSFLTLGGENGQQIRDNILHILQNNGVRGTTFLEQWHQKLHNNATPDDIGICDAYLAFLRSNGDKGTFYRVLWEGYGISREKLASYERPITVEPEFYGYAKDGLIRDFEAYLELNRKVHSRGDLFRAKANAEKYDAPGLNKPLWDFFTLKYQVETSQVEQGWVKLLDKLVEVRRELRRLIFAGGDWWYLRDLVFLDLSLEEYSRTISDKISEQVNDQEIMWEAARNLSLQLENIVLSSDADDWDMLEINIIKREWDKIQQEPIKDEQWHLHSKAILDRLQRVIGDRIQKETELLQPKAELLGNQVLAEKDKWAIPLFSEELVRGSPLFSIANILKPLRKAARQKALLPPWDVIVPGRVSAEVRKAKSLKEILAGIQPGDRIIAVVKDLDGSEDIPPQIAGIISQREVDITSHLAVRARNLKVPFVFIDSEEEFQTVYQNDRPVKLHVFEGMTKPWQVYTGDLSMVSIPAEIPEITIPSVDLTAEPACLKIQEFTMDKVGPKGSQIKQLMEDVSEKKDVTIPNSVDVPYGVYQAVLKDKNNLEIAQQIQELIARADAETARDAAKQYIAEIERLTKTLVIPDEILKPILDAIKQEIGEDKILMVRSSANGEDLEKYAGAGLYESYFNVSLDKVEQHIKWVWASKWTERAYWSRRDMKIDHDQIHVSALIQECFHFDYSFVIHTVNPVNNDPDEVMIEVAQGLGEAIVANYPGSAYRFIYNKKTHEVRRIAFASKSLKCIIKDGQLQLVSVDYSDDFLAGPKEQWEEVIRSIGEAGCLIEEKRGGNAQDIEGGYFSRYADKPDILGLVQTRDQMIVEIVTEKPVGPAAEPPDAVLTAA